MATSVIADPKRAFHEYKAQFDADSTNETSWETVGSVSGVSGLPSDAQYGELLTFNAEPYRTQIYYSFVNQKIYIRYNTSATGSWSQWNSLSSVEAIPDSAITLSLGTVVFANNSWCDKGAVNLNFEVAQVQPTTTNAWAQIAVLDEKYCPSTTCFGFGLSTNSSYLNPKFCLVRILNSGSISVMNTENSNNYYFIQCYFNRA